MAATIECKACTKCFRVKTLDQFHRNPTGQYGRSSWCAVCMSAHLRAYRRGETVKREKAEVAPSLARAGDRVGWQTEAGIERDSRSQEVALLGADLSRLRKALNEWWQESGEGQQAECGTTWLAARVILRAAAEKDRAIQRRRSR